MPFAISSGSDVSGAERYVVYVPFTLAPGASLGALDRPAISSGNGYQITIEKIQHLYAISLGTFGSRDEANSYMGKVHASLLWQSLKFKCGVSYPKALSDVNLWDQPIPCPETGAFAKLFSAGGWSETDGYYEASKAVIRPDHKRLMRLEVGKVSLTYNIGVNNFITSIQQALSLPCLERVVEDKKLKLAIEIYAAYPFELSKNAQLITLVTALEALLPDSKIPAHSNASLLQAKEAIGAARDAHPKSSEEWRDINNLLSRVGNLQREAIGTSIREYASSVSSRHPHLGDARHNSEKLQSAYNVRSTLLHEGQSSEKDVDQSLSFLREYVPRFLETLYKEVAGITEQ